LIFVLLPSAEATTDTVLDVNVGAKPFCMAAALG
jgi:hypothetical protein